MLYLLLLKCGDYSIMLLTSAPRINPDRNAESFSDGLGDVYNALVDDVVAAAAFASELRDAEILSICSHYEPSIVKNR